jgi:hypothetical protein
MSPIDGHWPPTASNDGETLMTQRESSRRDTQRMASSVDEFCGRNHICRETAYGEIRNGRLIARKVGKRTLIFKEDEDAWRNSLPVLVLGSAA